MKMTEPTVRRHSWAFEYTASKLAEAAEERRNHHIGRVEWWKGKRKEVLEQIKADGIDVEESIAKQSYDNNQPTFGPRVVVKAEYQQQLNECYTKIKEHDRLAKEYDGWVQVLKANPEARLELNIDDYLYFFRK